MLYEVIIPAGCLAGDTFQVQLGATVFEVAVPDGCGEGSSISIEADTDGEQAGPRTVEVEIPAGCFPGDEFLVETAEATLTVVVPDGCSPGTMLEIALPSTPQPPVMEAPSTADAMQELALGDARSKSTPYGLYAPGGLYALPEAADGTPVPDDARPPAGLYEPGGLYALPDSESAPGDGVPSPPHGLYAPGGLYALPSIPPAPRASPLHAKLEDSAAAPMWSPSSVQSRLDLGPTPLHGSSETGSTGGGCYWADGTAWVDPATAEKGASAMVTPPGEFDFDDSYLIQRSDGSYSLGYIQEYDAGSELYRVLIPGVGFKYVAREQIELDTVHF